MRYIFFRIQFVLHLPRCGVRRPHVSQLFAHLDILLVPQRRMPGSEEIREIVGVRNTLNYTFQKLLKKKIIENCSTLESEQDRPLAKFRTRRGFSDTST